MDWKRLLGLKPKPQAPKASANLWNPRIGPKWMVLGDLPITSGRMWVGDVQFAPIEEDGEVVDVPVGIYEVSVMWGDGDSEAILRAVLKGTEAERGEKIGETWADTASQAVCDFEAYGTAVGEDHNAYWEKSDMAILSEIPGRYELAPGAVLIHCTSGDGDGTFPLYEIASEGNRVGIEVDFYAED